MEVYKNCNIYACLATGPVLTHLKIPFKDIASAKYILSKENRPIRIGLFLREIKSQVVSRSKVSNVVI